MIVDFVRAGNDHGSLGFLTKKERLNVLLSRQRMHLFVVGDTTCTKAAYTADPTLEEDADLQADPATITPGNDRRNQWVIKVLEWFQQRGRVVEIDITTLTETYVSFTKEEVAEGVDDLPAWENDPQDEGMKEENGKEEKGRRRRGRRRRGRRRRGRRRGRSRRRRRL